MPHTYDCWLWYSFTILRWIPGHSCRPLVLLCNSLVYSNSISPARSSSFKLLAQIDATNIFVYRLVLGRLERRKGSCSRNMIFGSGLSQPIIVFVNKSELLLTSACWPTLPSMARCWSKGWSQTRKKNYILRHANCLLSLFTSIVSIVPNCQYFLSKWYLQGNPA